MINLPTDDECEIIESWGRRQGAVPPFREASAEDDAKGRIGAVKALRALGDAVEVIGLQELELRDLRAQVAEHERQGHMSMGLGPKRDV